MAVVAVVMVATKGEWIEEKKTGRINNNCIVRDTHLAWLFGQVQRRHHRCLP